MRDLLAVGLLPVSVSFLGFRVVARAWPRSTILELRFSRYLRSMREWEDLAVALGLMSDPRTACSLSRLSKDLRGFGHWKSVDFGFDSDLTSVEETWTGLREEDCLFFE